MVNRRYPLGVSLLTLVLSRPAPAQQAQAPVLLRLAPPTGQVSRYRTVQAVSARVTLIDSVLTADRADTALSKQTVSGGDGDVRHVEIVMTPVTAHSSMSGLRLASTVSTRGAIVQTSTDVSQEFQQLLDALSGAAAELPEEPVEPGATWTTSIDMALPIPGVTDATFNVRQTHRLDQLDASGGSRIAVISHTGTVTPILTTTPEANAPRFELRGRVTGETRIDLDAGRVSTLSETVRLDGTVTIQRGNVETRFPIASTTVLETALLDSSTALSEATAAYGRSRERGDYERMQMLSEIGSATGPTAPGRDRLDSALVHYRTNRLRAALPLLADAVVASPDNAEAYAWLGETLRRLDSHDASARAARAALARVPCHSFAHTIVADVHNPQYSGWEHADADTTWTHLRSAVACDSTDGNAWVGIWLEAMRRKDQDVEQRAIRRLAETAFFASPWVAMARWVLHWLPDRALLLVNGDMDFFPARTLQQQERLRPDVAVVNVSLLNTAWYARLVRDRHRVPLPIEDRDLDRFESYEDEEGSTITQADSIVRGWMAYRRSRRLNRPLVAASTMGDLERYGGAGEFVNAGPYRIHVTDAAAHSDTTVARAAFGAITLGDLSGPKVSAKDRSPVRAEGGPVAGVVLQSALSHAEALFQDGFVDAAYELATWAERGARAYDRSSLYAAQEHVATYHNAGSVAPVARNKLEEGRGLVTDGNVSAAIAAYAEAPALDTALMITPNDWNHLCWFGSLWEQASQVLAACERAVTLASDQGWIRDSRGLARAMTGDLAGAIEDFEAYLAGLGDEASRSDRQRWVTTLRSGSSPFTRQVVWELRLNDVPGLWRKTVDAIPLDGRRLTVGEAVDDTLPAGETVTPFGAFFRVWGLDLRAGDSVTIDMLSEDLDAYLWASGPGIDEMMEDDDSGGACDARLSLVAPADGSYRVVASSATRNETGHFRLLVTREPGPLTPGACR